MQTKELTFSPFEGVHRPKSEKTMKKRYSRNFKETEVNRRAGERGCDLLKGKSAHETMSGVPRPREDGRGYKEKIRRRVRGISTKKGEDMKRIHRKRRNRHHSLDGRHAGREKENAAPKLHMDERRRLNKWEKSREKKCRRGEKKCRLWNSIDVDTIKTESHLRRKG